MPITTARDERRKWLLARATGSLSLDETMNFLRTARAHPDMRLWPLVFDARACRTTMSDADVETAVGIVRDAAQRGEQRGHVALVADDERLYRWCLLYETRCAAAGVRLIRTFSHLDDASRWLDIVSASREFG